MGRNGSRTSQLACAYCGYVFVVVFCVGFVGVAGFVPPPSPAAGPAEIAAFFRAGAVDIRIGMCITLFASALLLPWGAAVAVQVKRLEGRFSPVTYLWVAATGCIVIEFLYPAMFWSAAAFRPDDPDVLIRKFDDLAWLPWLGIISTGVVQAVALGFLVLLDRRRQPLFPRWFGYFQFWAALGLCPAELDIFFHTGPLAWNGVVTFWLPVTSAVLWLVLTTACTAAAIKRQPADVDPHEPSDVDPHLPADVDPHLPSDVDPHLPSDVDPHLPADVDPHLPSDVDPRRLAERIAALEARLAAAGTPARD